MAADEMKCNITIATQNQSKPALWQTFGSIVTEDGRIQMWHRGES